MNTIKQEKIMKLIENNEFSGVISIRKNNNIIYEQCGGYKNIDLKTTIDLQTNFGLASGAKTYTAIAILKLHENGKLNINDPIFNYLGQGFMDYDETVTIWHLLTHTSGIPDYLDEEKNEDLSHIPWNQLRKPKDYFPYFPQREMDFKPGTRFKYNNGAFILLAHIIEILTGNYHEYIHEILSQVGINKTRYYTFDHLPENTARGYVFTDDSYITNEHLLPIIGGGDGGIFSNIDDIHKLWISLFQSQLLSKDTFDLMISKHASSSDDTHYGLGVWIKEKDQRVIEMIGQDQGVSFYSGYRLETEEIITIISNNDKDTWNILKILDS